MNTDMLPSVTPQLVALEVFPLEAFEGFPAADVFDKSAIHIALKGSKTKHNCEDTMYGEEPYASDAKRVILVMQMRAEL